MNCINIIGNITKDIELKKVNDKSVAHMTIAVSDSKEVTYFIDCVAWNAVADTLAKYFHKGNKIGVTGKLSTRTYDRKDGSKAKAVEVIVNNITFIEKAEKHEREKFETPDPTDDLPF